jgi:hypothetical protein
LKMARHSLNIYSNAPTLYSYTGSMFLELVDQVQISCTTE